MASGCIYVDDAGNPGVQSGSDFLPSSRKSWTAVIVPSGVEGAVEVAVAIFLKGLKDEFGATELHFTDIYSGRGIWKDVAIPKRIEIFDLMKSILESFSLPIVHQTTSKESLRDYDPVFSRLSKSTNSWWDIKNVSHLGFLLLCSNLFRYISGLRNEGSKDFEAPMALVVDEGIAKAGSNIDLPNWGSVIAMQKVFFSRSVDTPGIQIADFAAFTISRTQWIMAQQKKGQAVKRGDIEFLKMTARLNIINLAMLPFWSRNISQEGYESALEEDRRIKGLPTMKLKTN
jgi:hypothetical protein